MRKILSVTILVGIAGLAGFSPCRAQTTMGPFGIGASVGDTNAVDHHFQVNLFRSGDANVWFQYQMDENLTLRATYGSMKVDGFNARQFVPASPGSDQTVQLGSLTDRMDYALLSAAYEFREGIWTSGIFGGVGGYRVKPRSNDPLSATYNDARETVWGVHMGVDADVVLFRNLSFVGRITYHAPQGSLHIRSLLTADGGFLYRF